MKCLLCGKEYIALGVHLRHKHQVDPVDYREEFGLLKTAPLVDDSLSKQISDSATMRMKDPEYKEYMSDICRRNAKKNIGTTPSEMSKAGREKLSKRNKEANELYLKKKAPLVEKILRDKKTLLDVRNQTGMGREGVKRIVSMGLATYNKKDALIIGTHRRVQSRLNNKKQ